MPRTSDEILVERARAGDRTAADELCKRYRAPLVGFCYRYVGDNEIAEDAAQDVLAKITAEERWPTGSFRAWLFRLARNHCINLCKLRRDGRVGLGTFFGQSSLASPQLTTPKLFVYGFTGVTLRLIWIKSPTRFEVTSRPGP